MCVDVGTSIAAYVEEVVMLMLKPTFVMLMLGPKFDADAGCVTDRLGCSIGPHPGLLSPKVQN